MQKNTEISERISEMIEVLDLNPNSFAKELGYPRAQTVYDIVNAKSAPSYDFFRRFQLSEYSELISLDWLLTGRGEKLINKKTESKNTHPNAHPNAHLSDKKPYQIPEFNQNNLLREPTVQYGVKVRKDQLRTPLELLPKKAQAVPYYNLPVSAGALGVLESDVYTTEPDGYLELPAFDGCEAVFPITGVSMEPLLSSGDLIGIRSIDNLSRSWEFLQTDVIYLIITREDRMIKFIERATDEDYIVCKSPNAGAFKVFKGDILKLYRVRACVKKL